MASSYSRDGTYYFADGNVTILVSTTLFKVHRPILARDGSTFVDLFALDNIATTNSGSDSRILEGEGTTDENPILLQGDTVDEFRDLLCVLYALPSEIATIMAAKGDLIQLSNVVRMVHKYHYITTEAWALRTLLACFSSQPVASLLTHSLVQITEVAVLCENKPLLDAVRREWKYLVAERKDLAIAINVMGRLGIRDIESLAYYGMLLEGRQRWDSDPNLTRDQRIRLLSGYYNLTEASEALTHTPPKFVHHPNCAYENDCNDEWTIFWNLVTCSAPDVGIGSPTPIEKCSDLMGKLGKAVNVMMALDKDTENRRNHMGCNFWYSNCHGEALQETMRLSKETEENMVNFFVDLA